MSEYNESHPNSRYADPVRFARDVRAAYKRVMNPKLVWEGKEDRPLAKVQIRFGGDD